MTPVHGQSVLAAMARHGKAWQSARWQVMFQKAALFATGPRFAKSCDRQKVRMNKARRTRPYSKNTPQSTKWWCPQCPVHTGPILFRGDWAKSDGWQRDRPGSLVEHDITRRILERHQADDTLHSQLTEAQR